MEPIIATDEIPDQGHRFTYREGPLEEEGILLRLPGDRVLAYKNECRHLPMRLDAREPRELWHPSGRYLCCSSHGALYQPEDGLCIAGPCRGAYLKQLPIVVRDGWVLLDTGRLRIPSPAP